MQRSFLYCLDPVFLTALALYLLNRFVFKPLEGPHGGFCHSYVNDLLCIPFCLPPCLRVYRLFGVRDHDRPPTRFEMLAHLIVWSIVFEVTAPRMGGIFAWTVADPWDVAAYATGTLVAGVCWGAFRVRSQKSPSTERSVHSEAAHET